MGYHRVHFVCNGNVYRSKLAEAYAKSYKVPGVVFSSSGLMFWEHDPRPMDYVSPWAIKIGRKDGIDKLLWGMRQKTTNALLAKQDLIIFANQKVYNRAKRNLKFDERKVIVWNVRDVHEWEKKLELGAMQKRARTRRYIKMKVKELVRILAETTWVDVVDENNKPQGYVLPPRFVKMWGLYSRGVHAFILTADNRIVIQKRSRQIMMAPGLIDITMGGHVDAGETPRTAMKREMFEEMGLKVPLKNMKFLEIYRKHAWHPKYKMKNRIFVYVYFVRLAENDPKFVVQEREVEWAKIVSIRQAMQLINRGSIPGLGQINYPRAFYKSRLSEIKSIVKKTDVL